VRSVSWEPLADTDPLPGDPAVLSGAAGTLNLTALDLAMHASTVQAVDAGPAFVGLAAQRFVELRDESATKVSAAAARCSGAGAALTLCSSAVAHAQEVGAAPAARRDR
jgi:hypothetical protein